MQEQVWKAHDADAGIWVADYWVGANVRSRSTAVKLEGGGVAVISPGRVLAKQSDALFAETGPLKLIVAPNSVHNNGLPAWREAFPNVPVICAERARKRLEKRGHRITGSLNLLESSLPGHIRLLEVPFCRIGEIWLSARTVDGTVWIICDGFLNLPSLPSNPLGRLVMKMLNMAPGLRVTRQWQWLFIKNRKTYKDWFLGRLEEDAPTVLIPAHGPIVRDGELPKSLSEAMF